MPAPRAWPSGRRRGWGQPLWPSATFLGGNDVELLRGGDALLPAMREAIGNALHDVWIATYIFHDDPAAHLLCDALVGAAERGVRVRVVVDGFGSKAALSMLHRRLDGSGVALSVFRPVDRWWRVLQPGNFRRLHHKLCVVDGDIGFVGGVNIIDDRNDLHHGWSEAPRLDFAVRVRGAVVAPIEQTARALWQRAWFGQDLRDEVMAIARSAAPVASARRLLARMRSATPGNPLLAAAAADPRPVRCAFVVRDNLRRRAIERAYIEAIRSAETRIDLASPYFYPGRLFRRVLRDAARRGVRVRLLLQGKLDYRIAGLAAQVLYDELLTDGVRIFEYTPAFLHAKVALADADWATVGSSNIDPLSLLLNLEANLIVRDRAFADQLAGEFDAACAASREITPAQLGGRGFWRTAQRGFVAWCAHVYLRMAGITGRY